MEISEKLDIFYQAAIDAANGQSAVMLDKYREQYEGNLAEYRRMKEEQQQTRGRIAQEGVRKEVNRVLSEELVRLKKEYHKIQDEKKTELFALVEQKLSEYRASEAYLGLLEGKVNEALKFANGAEMQIYIDPADAQVKETLEARCGCEILVSAYAFGGGMRAVIPSKHVLMDESFDSKLEAEREKFSF